MEVNLGEREGRESYDQGVIYERIKKKLYYNKAVKLNNFIDLI